MRKSNYWNQVQLMEVIVVIGVRGNQYLLLIWTQTFSISRAKDVLIVCVKAKDSIQLIVFLETLRSFIIPKFLVIDIFNCLLLTEFILGIQYLIIIQCLEILSNTYPCLIRVIFGFQIGFQVFQKLLVQKIQMACV